MSLKLDKSRRIICFSWLYTAAVFMVPFNVSAQPADSGHLDVGTVEPGEGFFIVGDAAGQELRSKIGAATGGGGDFDGDGYDDLLISSHESFPAKTWLIYGNDNPSLEIRLSELDGSNGFLINGESNAGRLAMYVTSDRTKFIGDFNGDGLDDVAIGIGTFKSDLLAHERQGAVYVLFGSTQWRHDQIDELSLSTLSGRDGFRIMGMVGDFIGTNVTGGDFNGDGLADIAFGAMARNQKGGAYVIYGRHGHAAVGPDFDVSALDGINGYRIEAPPMVHVGASVSNLGDLNGDGLDDLGIVNNSKLNTLTGYIVYGHNRENPVLELEELTPAQGVELVGPSRTINGIGDLNNDGLGDFILNTFRQIPRASGIVIYGSTDLPATINFSDSEQIGSLGFPVFTHSHIGVNGTPGGDFNGDGLQDSLLYDSGVAITLGMSAVLYGSNQKFSGELDLAEDLDGSNGIVIRDFIRHHYRDFAVSASSIGDFNGDGFDDILLATPRTTAFHDIPSYRDRDRGGGIVVFGGDDIGTSRQSEESLLKDVALGRPAHRTLNTNNEETTAIISVNTTSALGEPFKSGKFQHEEPILLTVGVIPDLDDIGKPGAFYVVVRNNNKDWFMLNNEQQFVAWDQQLSSLQATRLTNSLSAQEYFLAVEGFAESGGYAFYAAYSSDAAADGSNPSTVHFNDDPHLVYVD